VRKHVLWVNILAGEVIEAVFCPGESLQVVNVYKFPDTAGAVAVSASGELLVAGRNRLYVRRVDGTITAGPLVFGEEAGRRLNDGKVDPAGRFVVGSLRHLTSSGREVLLRIGRQGVVTIDDDVSLSNGLAWSVDGGLFYNVDSLARRIWVRSYDAEAGRTSGRRIFVEMREGLPDGICIDAEDHVWVAVWGRGEVLRFSPAGDLVGRVSVPCPNVTSVAFIGEERDTLIITSASNDLSTQQRRDFPLAGGLFELRPGVVGPDLALWSGELPGGLSGRESRGVRCS
jgi:sugar lactone lactonase YvrE